MQGYAGFGKQAAKYTIGDGTIISYFFNAIILSVLLFMPRDGVAQGTAPNQTPSPSFEDDPSKDKQDYSVEQDPSTASQQMHPEETPVILKEAEGKNSQEGIGDAFSKDQGDRFQSQNNKGIEFRPAK